MEKCSKLFACSRGLKSILNKGYLVWRGSQVVRPGTANPLFAGSIPARASINSPVRACIRPTANNTVHSQETDPEHP